MAPTGPRLWRQAKPGLPELRRVRQSGEGMDVVKKIQSAPAEGQSLKPPEKILKVIRYVISLASASVTTSAGSPARDSFPAGHDGVLRHAGDPAFAHHEPPGSVLLRIDPDPGTGQDPHAFIQDRPPHLRP
jgi:hypothetical protein